MRYVPRFARFLALATALAATAGMAGAAPALASTTVTVTVTGGGTFAARTSAATFATPTASFTCKSSTASITISDQMTTGATPLAIGTAVKFAFSTCTGPLGPTTVKVTSSTYQVAVTSVTSPAGLTKLTVGTFSTVFSMPKCQFTAAGTLPGNYDNSTQRVGMGPIPPGPMAPAAAPLGLTVAKASAGCAGVVSDGQELGLSARYSLTPRTLDIVSVKG